MQGQVFLFSAHKQTTSLCLGESTHISDPFVFLDLFNESLVFFFSACCLASLLYCVCRIDQDLNKIHLWDLGWVVLQVEACQ